MAMKTAALTRTARMSEMITMKTAAPTLQRVLGMKSILVGLLAALALSGCGVGMDDLEGQEAASGRSAASIMATSGDNTASGQGERRGPMDPRTALPQDPIPVFEGRSVAPSTPRSGK